MFIENLYMMKDREVLLSEYDSDVRVTGTLVLAWQDGVVLKVVGGVSDDMVFYPMASIGKIRLYTNKKDAEDDSVNVVDSMETKIKDLVDLDDGAESYSFDEDNNSEVSVDDSDGTVIDGDADELSLYNDDFKGLAVKIAKAIGCTNVKRHVVED